VTPSDPNLTSDPSPTTDIVVADLGSAVPTEGQGAVWSLPHGGDLDANLVRLDPGGTIDEHVNDVVDVLMFVQSGTGLLVVDGHPHFLRSDVLALIPRGSRRQVTAGPTGMYHLSVHRRRGPLTITRRA
jgi:quercetin dioxygenase-like cupin family protein